MAEFVDTNKVTWDVTIAGDTFTATPKVGGEEGYTNTTDAPINVDVQGVIVVWPVGGDPTLTGDTTKIKPGTAINAFITKQKPTFTLKVKAKPDASDAKAEAPPTTPTDIPKSPPADTPKTGAGNIGLILIVLGGAWLLFGKKSPLRKRRRR